MVLFGHGAPSCWNACVNALKGPSNAPYSAKFKADAQVCGVVHETVGVIVKIPVSQLSPRALRGVAEAFVLREGTDYGHRDHSLAEKCERVLEQLRNGEAEISFDPATDTFDIRLV